MFYLYLLNVSEYNGSSIHLLDDIGRSWVLFNETHPKEEARERQGLNVVHALL